MRFTPLTDQELAHANLIDPGQYNFFVVDAKERISKAGSDMIELKLRITDINHRERFVFDYLLEAMKFKLKHFTDATGLAEKYTAGLLTAEDCIGKTGSVEIIIQKSKDPNYADKNSVKDYIVDIKLSPSEISQEFFNDEVPF